jgi:hypothetical protein
VEQLEDRLVPSNFAAATVSDLIADINAANLAGGANTITLTAPTTSPYVLTAVNNTTDGPTGLPVIAKGDTLTIVGNGDLLERNSASNFRLLDVASQGALILESLTLQNGFALGSGVSAEGGAILNNGTLTLSGVTVEGNLAEGSAGVNRKAGQDAAGGGIYSTGSLTLEGSTKVQSNQALGGLGGPNSAGGSAFGGAIYVAGGAASLTNVIVSSNIAQGGQGGYGTALAAGGNGFGGGLYVSKGAVTTTSDTLSANTAQGGVGGFYIEVLPYEGWIYFYGPGGDGFGGGLYAGGGTISLSNDTVDFNTASGGSGNVNGQGEGGGLYIHTGVKVSLDAFTLANVINNTASTSNNDIFGSYTLVP